MYPSSCIHLPRKHDAGRIGRKPWKSFANIEKMGDDEPLVNKWWFVNQSIEMLAKDFQGKEFVFPLRKSMYLYPGSQTTIFIPVGLPSTIFYSIRGLPSSKRSFTIFKVVACRLPGCMVNLKSGCGNKFVYS